MAERKPLVLVNGVKKELPSGDTLPGQLKNNYSATTDPTATDDSSSGYSVGSRWTNTSTDTAWECVDSTVSAAVWKDLSTQGSGGGGVSITSTTLHFASNS